MADISLQLDTPALAADYERISLDRQFVAGQRLIAALAPPPGAAVLDIGAGTGLLAEYVAGLVGDQGHVTGIDPLPLRIEIANRKARANLSFEVGDALDLSSFAAESFDIIYLNAVFHWISDKAEALRQIFRVLKPGGRLGLATGAKEHPNPLHAIKAKVLRQPAYAAHAEGRGGTPGRVTAVELETLLTTSGFIVQRLEVAPHTRHHATAAAVIEFSEASSFGNFLGHLPPGLREAARREIEAELETLRTPEGIKFDTARLVGIAVKP